MSWTCADLFEWLRNEELSPRLFRADGGEWPDPSTLAAIVCDEATLDSRKAGAGSLFVGVRGELRHGRDYLDVALERGASAALLEAELDEKISWIAGSDRPVLLVQNGRAALSAMCRRYLAGMNAEVIGITGSNGKTTTKDLLRAALHARVRVGANPGNLNSQWGLPLAVLSQRGDESVLVLEMGASEPDEIGRLAAMTRPRVGCITNIGSAHLEQFKSVDEVARTKGQLVEALPPDGLCVLNRDDAHFHSLRERSGAEQLLSFGSHQEADLRITRCEQRGDGLTLEINGHRATLPVFGTANAGNVAAACAMASRYEVEVPEALAAMTELTLSPHRSRLLVVAGRTLLDDTYNANPVSLSSALRSLAAMPVQRHLAVIGSMRELGPESDRFHVELLELAHSLRIGGIFAVGEEMQHAAQMSGIGEVVPEEELPELLAARSAPGDAILFKASRGIGLERILDRLIEQWSRSEV